MDTESKVAAPAALQIPPGQVEAARDVRDARGVSWSCPIFCSEREQAASTRAGYGRCVLVWVVPIRQHAHIALSLKKLSGKLLSI